VVSLQKWAIGSLADITESELGTNFDETMWIMYQTPQKGTYAHYPQIVMVNSKPLFLVKLWKIFRVLTN